MVSTGTLPLHSVPFSGDLVVHWLKQWLVFLGSNKKFFRLKGELLWKTIDYVINNINYLLNMPITLEIR